MKGKTFVVSLALLFTLAPGCSDITGPDPEPEPKIFLDISPIELFEFAAAVEDAVFRLLDNMERTDEVIRLALDLVDLYSSMVARDGTAATKALEKADQLLTEHGSEMGDPAEVSFVRLVLDQAEHLIEIHSRPIPSESVASISTTD